MPYELIDSPPAVVMDRVSLLSFGAIDILRLVASEVLYEESVHPESSTTPSIECDVEVARFGSKLVVLVDS